MKTVAPSFAILIDGRTILITGESASELHHLMAASHAKHPGDRHEALCELYRRLQERGYADPHEDWRPSPAASYSLSEGCARLRLDPPLQMKIWITIGEHMKHPDLPLATDWPD